ncbi:methylated-DNA--[protein]-cysteine S-methyltransferase [Gordonibacter pamelaeae]|uniref:methylated-DNA--[protein]-cysteine S-methyltransferase n=1 Tax=Gordonibacter pamelaeae TaxID=471189 RepID=UPI003A93C87A
MTGPAPTYFAYRTPLGHVTIASDGQALTALAFGERELEGRKLATELTNRAANQLQEYLAGRRRAFDLPLAPAGTEFQRRVWAALREVPYGQARSYSDVAAAIGSPRSCRAVGSACNKNPLPVIVPSHRVVGANGNPCLNVTVEAALRLRGAAVRPMRFRPVPRPALGRPTTPLSGAGRRPLRLRLGLQGAPLQVQQVRLGLRVVAASRGVRAAARAPSPIIVTCAAQARPARPLRPRPRGEPVP